MFSLTKSLMTHVWSVIRKEIRFGEGDDGTSSGERGTEGDEETESHQGESEVEPGPHPTWSPLPPPRSRSAPSSSASLMSPAQDNDIRY